MRCIVFDLGGVLLRWQPAQLLRRTLPLRAVDAAGAEHWAAQIFQSDAGEWGDFDRGSVEVEDLVPRIALRTGLGRDEVQRVVDAVPHELQPQPESVALLRRLHAAGERLFFLSNMPAPYARHLETTYDFMALFDDGMYSSRVGHNKPEPAIYALSEQRFGVAPGGLLFIDDHAPNVAAARARGWQALHYAGAAQIEAELRRLGRLS